MECGRNVYKMLRSMAVLGSYLSFFFGNNLQFQFLKRIGNQRTFSSSCLDIPLN